MLAPWGAFGASFPGIVVGWGTAAAFGLAIPQTAGAVIGGGALSWFGSWLLATAGASSTALLRGSAIFAAAAYAGFAWPAVFETWNGLLKISG